MNDDELLRYSRHIQLPRFGAEGQERLRASRVLVIGAGGLGSPVALYLAAAGVGKLTIADPDEVDLANLQRQILHRTADIGRPKVESARDTLGALNPNVTVATRAIRLEGDALAEAVAKVDLTVDGTDNFETRFALNRACVETGKPWVYGAAIRMEGQVSLFDTAGGGPCYQCLYRDDTRAPDETCSTNGILAPVVGIVGSIQATEAIKHLAGVGETLRGRLLLIDAERMDIRTLKLTRDPQCPVCGGGRS